MSVLATLLYLWHLYYILDDRLIQNVGDYILSCQTFEGGIAGEPGSKAHGGIGWCSGVECGFQGRTNKVVDGCYSFWQGGMAAIIQRLHLTVNKQLGVPNSFTFDSNTESENDSSDSDEELSVESSSRQSTKEGKSDTSAPMGVTSGYEFVRRPIGMRPIFNSLALQQYILLSTRRRPVSETSPGSAETTIIHATFSADFPSPSIAMQEMPTLDVMGPYSN